MDFERLDMTFLENPKWLRLLESLSYYQDWVLQRGQQIRRPLIDDRGRDAVRDVFCCPLTSSHNVAARNYLACARAWSFTGKQADIIAAVADLAKPATALEQAMRTAMLQACHLTESSHDRA